MKFPYYLESQNKIRIISLEIIRKKKSEIHFFSVKKNIYFIKVISTNDCFVSILVNALLLLLFFLLLNHDMFVYVWSDCCRVHDRCSNVVQWRVCCLEVLFLTLLSVLFLVLLSTQPNSNNNNLKKSLKCMHSYNLFLAYKKNKCIKFIWIEYLHTCVVNMSEYIWMKINS